jgi:FeS assembly SUF system protein
MFEWLSRRRHVPARQPMPEPPAAAQAPPGAGAAKVARDRLEQRVIAVLKTIYDPEIPVNIHDLGLIYGLDLDEQGVVAVRMTLTAPGCPVAQTFPGTVEAAVKGVEGVSAARVDLVWDPPWTPERMTEEARLELGML